MDKKKVKVIGMLKDVKIQLTVNLWIQHVIDIHVIDILETSDLRREWTKFLRGWFSMNFI